MPCPPIGLWLCAASPANSTRPLRKLSAKPSRATNVELHSRFFRSASKGVRSATASPKWSSRAGPGRVVCRRAGQHTPERRPASGRSQPSLARLNQTWNRSRLRFQWLERSPRMKPRFRSAVCQPIPASARTMLCDPSHPTIQSASHCSVFALVSTVAVRRSPWLREVIRVLHSMWTPSSSARFRSTDVVCHWGTQRSNRKRGVHSGRIKRGRLSLTRYRSPGTAAVSHVR